MFNSAPTTISDEDSDWFLSEWRITVFLFWILIHRRFRLTNSCDSTLVLQPSSLRTSTCLPYSMPGRRKSSSTGISRRQNASLHVKTRLRGPSGVSLFLTSFDGPIRFPTIRSSDHLPYLQVSSGSSDRAWFLRFYLLSGLSTTPRVAAFAMTAHTSVVLKVLLAPTFLRVCQSETSLYITDLHWIRSYSRISVLKRR